MNTEVTLDNIYNSLILDASLMPPEGITKENYVKELAEQRYRQHINNEMALSLAKAVQAIDPFAVATAVAEKMGYSSFKEGEPGREKRGEIAEAIKREQKKSVPPSYRSKFVDFMKDAYGIEMNLPSLQKEQRDTNKKRKTMKKHQKASE